jgi:hypothetical protein
VNTPWCSDSTKDQQQAEAAMREVLLLDATKELSSSRVGRLRHTQQTCFWRLAETYIARAGQAGTDPATSAELIAYVESLSQWATEADAADFNSFNATAVRATLGRAFSRAGMHAAAREQLRTNVEVALVLLSDDDPLNDWQGYRHLGRALMDYGDLDNAAAAWSMIGPITSVRRAAFLPLHETEHAASPGLDGASPEPANGADRKAASKTGDLTLPTVSLGRMPMTCTYARCDCRDVQFDAGCLAKLRAGSLKADACNPDHCFLHVPTWDQG